MRVQAFFVRLTILVLALALAIGTAWAQQRPVAPRVGASTAGQAAGPGDRTISMDFSGVDLDVFVKFISELTGKNFVIDERVRGKVTVLSPRRISVDEAYRVFESVLQVYGFIAVPAGDITKIIPVRDSPTAGLPTMTGATAGAGDGYVTQVIPLHNADADQVIKILTPMVSKSGLITAYGPTGLLIVTDSESNIRRLMQVVRSIDTREGNQRMVVIPLKHASADKMAAKITKMIPSTMAAGQPAGAGVGRMGLSVQADERSNSLIVLGEPKQVDRVRQLAAELDKPVQREQGNIRVYKLEHADAIELAQVLTGLVGRKPVATNVGRGNTSSSSSGSSTAFPPTGSSSVGALSSGSVGSSTNASGGSQSHTDSGVALQPAISSDVTIIPDKATNSLVITSGPDDYDELVRIIKTLDRPRKQVLVEALIMEVSSDQNVQIGTQFQGGFSTTGLGPNGGLVGGFSNPSGTGIGLLNPAGAAGIGLGAAAIPVVINGVTFTNLDALITFGKNNSDFNIISTPQIMTLDNQEATITVAENRPFQTASSVGQSTTDYTVNQYQYRDVGTILKITPQINEGGNIKLKIFQEFSEIDQTATGKTSNLLPVTRKRTTDTTVLIQERQTVVLSGLIGKTTTHSTTKVPGLGDVPLLGWLFKVKRDQERKTNLLVFITPRIVDTPQAATDLYITKVKEFEQIQFDKEDRVRPVIMPLTPALPAAER